MSNRSPCTISTLFRKWPTSFNLFHQGIFTFYFIYCENHFMHFTCSCATLCSVSEILLTLPNPSIIISNCCRILKQCSEMFWNCSNFTWIRRRMLPNALEYIWSHLEFSSALQLGSEMFWDCSTLSRNMWECSQISWIISVIVSNCFRILELYSEMFWNGSTSPCDTWNCSKIPRIYRGLFQIG